MHGGEDSGRLRQGLTDCLTTPIVQTSTYTFKDTAQLIAYQEGRHGSFEYGRYRDAVTGVEAGFLLEAYTRRLVILSPPSLGDGDQLNHRFFPSVYLTLYFGQRS